MGDGAHSLLAMGSDSLSGKLFIFEGQMPS